ncbi:hypothetical protein RUND412_006735 [Rhizina undulata]
MSAHHHSGPARKTRSHIKTALVPEPLDIPSLDTSRAPSPTFPSDCGSDSSGADEPVTKTLMKKLSQGYSRNQGICLLLLAQFFASLMALTTRYLSTSLPNGVKFHALQILFVRMGITMVCCLVWMWWNGVEYAPFGRREVRPLLIARGLGGFVGVFGLYSKDPNQDYADSLSYLPLPDATVITFLVPTVVGFTCSIIPALREPFTTTEKLGGLISLLGVTLIARPKFLYSIIPSLPRDTPPSNEPDVSPSQRIVAVTVALIGVLGAATAYTTIRWIGKRAHPLISVTYFSSITTLISLMGLLLIPSVGGIVIPHGFLQWGLLLGIGVSGFVMQFLLTKGLQLEKAGRAGSMVYTQMVFALIFEWLVWGNVPGLLSIIGGGMILGSALVVNIWKGKDTQNKGNGKQTSDEERPLMGTEDREN